MISMELSLAVGLNFVAINVPISRS